MGRNLFCQWNLRELKVYWKEIIAMVTISLYFCVTDSYVIDLTYYLLTKTDGNSWQGDPAVDRLVEARTVSVYLNIFS